MPIRRLTISLIAGIALGTGLLNLSVSSTAEDAALTLSQAGQPSYGIQHSGWQECSILRAPRIHDDASTEADVDVLLNDSLTHGLATSVCTKHTGSFSDILVDSVGTWNDILRPMLGFNVFAEPQVGSGDCDGSNIEVLDTRSPGVTRSCMNPYEESPTGSWAGTRACHKFEEQSDPPRKLFKCGSNGYPTWSLIIYQAFGNNPADTTAHVSTKLLELGHALGLTDSNNGSDCDPGLRDGVVDIERDDFSLMGRSSDECRATAFVTGRDLRDLYEAYHVGAVRGVGVAGDVTVISGFEIGLPSDIIDFRFEWEDADEAGHGASRLVVLGRNTASSSWRLIARGPV